MNSKDFARVLVEEVVDSNPPDSRGFISENGIDVSNLDDADEIWKAFVRYNIDAYGMKSGTVWKYWNELPDEALIKQREKLLDKIKYLKGLPCYNNFTTNCPVTYKKTENFVDAEKCYHKDFFMECPVVNLIQELNWHRAHYKIAKILAENVKRLLIEDDNGAKNGNLNDVVNRLINKYPKYPDDEKGKVSATEKLISKFDEIKGYGNPPKVITWFFSELSSPVHQVEHWPNLDYMHLSPVDTHVQRLMVRFKFINSKEVSNKNIEKKLSELYPEEPRKLDFGLYRLGGELEEGICGIKPKCELCQEKHPKLYKNCYVKLLI